MHSYGCVRKCKDLSCNQRMQNSMQRVLEVAADAHE